MKDFKTPKALEKRPVIAGHDLGTIVVVITCLLLAVFTFIRSIPLALAFLLIGYLHIMIKKKFPKKGALRALLKYYITVKCVRMNFKIEHLIKRENHKP